MTIHAVASTLSVTPKTVYEWLRGKGPLHPDHVRAELLQKIPETRTKPLKLRGRALPQIEVQGRRFHEPLVPPGTTQRVDDLPAAYRDRFWLRVKEVTRRARRELDEHLRVLEADCRAAQDKQR